MAALHNTNAVMFLHWHEPEYRSHSCTIFLELPGDEVWSCIYGDTTRCSSIYTYTKLTKYFPYRVWDHLFMNSPFWNVVSISTMSRKFPLMRLTIPTSNWWSNPPWMGSRMENKTKVGFLGSAGRQCSVLLLLQCVSAQKLVILSTQRFR